MKRATMHIASLLLILVLLPSFLSTVAFATADDSRNYNFSLTANQGVSTTVVKGEEITLSVVLERTDSNKSGTSVLRAVQDEIVFDSTFFALVEGSCEVKEGYDFSVRAMEDGVRKKIVISWVVEEDDREGAIVPDNLQIATFRLKALIPVEKEPIFSTNYKVHYRISVPYVTTANNVEITVKSPQSAMYTVSYEGGTGATGKSFSEGLKEAGARFVLPANSFAKEGHVFAGWNDGSATYQPGDSYTMPEHAVAFTAQWDKSSGGDSPGGDTGSGVIVPPSKPQTEEPTINVEVPVVVEGMKATAVIDEEELNRALGERTTPGILRLDIGAEAQDISSVSIPSSALQTICQAAQGAGKVIDGLVVPLTKGEVEFDAGALETVSKAARDVPLEIVLEDAAGLTDAQKAVVQKAPVYDIRVVGGGNDIVHFAGSLTIYLPYTLKPGQSADGVMVYCIYAHGQLVDMKAKYDPVRRVVYFTTDHLSVYMLSYDDSLVRKGPSAPYLDVDQSAWYLQAVDYAIENGLFVGTSNSTFEPNLAMTRAMLVTVLWRMENQPMVATGTVFEDVAEGTWYSEPVAWAFENHIVEGYGNGCFGPDHSLTREQIAVVLQRYAVFKGRDVSVQTELTEYQDAETVSPWAHDGMKWAVSNKLIIGVTDTTLEPHGDATRAQVAMILMRFLTE